jgi:periplasmic protein TonB
MTVSAGATRKATMTEERVLTRKAIFASLGLHSLIIAAVVLFGASVARHPETILVLLTLDPPAAGGGGAPKASDVVKKGLQTPAPARKQETAKRPRVATRAVDTKAAANRAVERSVPPVSPEGALPVSAALPVATGSIESPPAAGRTDSGPRGGGGGGVGSGSGGGAGTGTGSFAGPGHGRDESAALEKRYRDEQFEYIKALLKKNMIYPPMAKKHGWKGKGEVYFVVREDGRVEDLKIERSSGYEVLDSDFMDTIRRTQPFPRPPKRAGLGMTFSYALE